MTRTLPRKPPKLSLRQKVERGKMRRVALSQSAQKRIKKENWEIHLDEEVKGIRRTWASREYQSTYVDAKGKRHSSTRTLIQLLQPVARRKDTAYMSFKKPKVVMRDKHNRLTRDGRKAKTWTYEDMGRGALDQEGKVEPAYVSQKIDKKTARRIRKESNKRRPMLPEAIKTKVVPHSQGLRRRKGESWNDFSKRLRVTGRGIYHWRRVRYRIRSSGVIGEVTGFSSVAKAPKTQREYNKLKKRLFAESWMNAARKIPGSWELIKEWKRWKNVKLQA